MFYKEIEFSAHEDYFALKEDYPIPAKLNIPDWYKNLEHTVLNKTIKGCMPFLDTFIMTESPVEGLNFVAFKISALE